MAMESTPLLLLLGLATGVQNRLLPSSASGTESSRIPPYQPARVTILTSSGRPWHLPSTPAATISQSTPLQGNRQQRKHQSPIHPERPSTSSSVHTLRRTPRFDASPSSYQGHDRAPEPEHSDLGPRLAPSPALLPEQPREQSAPAPAGRQRRPGRKLSQDLSDDDDDLSSERSPSHRHYRPSSSRLPQRPGPHPALRVSKRTHKAILFTLEEAIRGPFVFTPDVAEELSEMTDVRSGLEPPSSNGIPAGRHRHGASGSPSGIRSPRMILQDREAREAARRIEQEQIQMERDRLEQEQLRMQRARSEEEARALEVARRRSAERRAADAAAAGGSRTQGVAADPVSPVDTSRRRQDQPQPQQPPQPVTPERGSSRVPQQHQQQQHLQQQQPQARPRRGTVTSQGQQQYSATNPAAAPSSQPPPRQHEQASASRPSGAAPLASTTKPQQPQQQRASFPHAFERWEALSAQWEGLTSHWIRRLELNASALDSDPVSQQLSRQVTDLSAAGANLFHAVVELQRLRASSERKFQRWFFETRADLERSHEVNAVLESQMEEMRGQLNERHSHTHERDSANSMVQMQLSEMKKELAISKEESRRAWEELGRREQLERERTLSLQAGQPTIVGGVQVVPMVQSASAASRRDPAREQPGVPGPGAYADYPQPPLGHPVTTTPPEGGYYREAEASVPQSTGYGPGSEGGYSEEDYEPRTTEAGAQMAATTSGDSQWAAAYTSPQDYTGSGYGSGWEAVPRHHHPTRLSDVLEEEESRTSASQVSRG